MAKPKMGRKIMRGVALWVEVLRQWWQVGFVPNDWDSKQMSDANAAIIWLIKLSTWYETKDDEE